MTDPMQIPVCWLCNCPVGDGSGLLPYVRVELAGSREIVLVCDLCMEKAD